MKKNTYIFITLQILAGLMFSQQLSANFITNESENYSADQFPDMKNSTSTIHFPEFQGEEIDGNFIMSRLYAKHINNVSRTNHFNWPGGKVSGKSWIIYIDEAIFNNLSLEAGDEIAIYDKQQGKIVGANKLTSVPVPGLFQQYIVAFNLLADDSPGYIPGNELLLKCWSSVDQFESQDFSVNFLNPYGDAYVPANNDFPSASKQYSISTMNFEPLVCPNDTSICSSDSVFPITGGLPEGGVYSGSGIENDTFFNPSLAGVGTHTILYSFVNDFNSVVYTCEFEITVNQPEVFIDGSAMVCPGATTTYSGPSGLELYEWMVSPNGFIVGPSNEQSVEILAADVCGEIFTLTLTVTDNAMCSASIDVDVAIDAPELTVTCPGDEILEACLSQEEVNAAFETWKNTFAFAGGCNTTATDLSGYIAPEFCGGEVTIAYTATDDCGQSQECTSTFTVLSAPELIVACPMETTLEACRTQDEVNVAFETWINEFTFDGGCNTTATDLSGYTAPEFCGGEVSITYNATDDCGQSQECTSTFTVLSAPELTVSCPGDEILEACLFQEEVNAAFETWKGTFAFAGGCNTTATDLSGYIAPEFCGGEVTIAYTATDDCGQSQECTSTFTVLSAPELTVSCPGDVTLNPCLDQAEVDTSFEIWVSSFKVEGGCNAIATDLSSLVPPSAEGGFVTVQYFASDDCNQSQECASTFTVQSPPIIDITCPEDFALCCDEDAINLSAIEGLNPMGGVFEGEGVSLIGDEYFFTPMCINTGMFEILYTYTEPDFGCIYNCSFNILVSPFPEAFAGVNDSIFSNETFALSMATVENAASVLWTSSGDGVFDDPTNLNPVYNPGEDDIINGSAELCLSALSFEGCEDAKSCLTLTLLSPLPHVSVEPGCFTLTLEQGQIFDRMIKINNVGFVDLQVSVSSDADWISDIQPVSTTIAPQSEEFVNVMFDATGLAIGDYSTELVILTDDPENAEILLPVTLSVLESLHGQSIHIPYGWSYVSSYIQPDDLEFETIFKDQLNCATIYFLLGKDGIFWPGQNINSMGLWDSYQGYKVKMNVDDQWIVEGDMVEDTDVQLPEGVNYLPVLSVCEVSAIEIFSQIEGRFEYALDLTDQEVYWPEGEIYTLETLIPGRAYLIKMNQEGIVSYGECNKNASIGNEYSNMSHKQQHIPIHKTGSQHIISIYAEALAGFNVGDVIAAYNSDELCVGYAEIKNLKDNLGLVIYGDDFLSSEVDGMYVSESIRLQHIPQGSLEGVELEFQFDPTMPNYLPEFADQGLSGIITFFNSTSVSVLDKENFSAQIYPNPSNGDFMLSIDQEGFKSCTLEIYRIDGQLLKVQNIEQPNTTIRANDLPSGVYLLNILIDHQIINKRLIIQ